mmetsp:Transcript_12216/g.22570  ORF Transcript_12216/g.22570 Transcript_12216/m.22570 type:complete len:220 (-) Transcript_12216:7-666(-)
MDCLSSFASFCLCSSAWRSSITGCAPLVGTCMTPPPPQHACASQPVGAVNPVGGKLAGARRLVCCPQPCGKVPEPCSGAPPKGSCCELSACCGADQAGCARCAAGRAGGTPGCAHAAIVFGRAGGTCPICCGGICVIITGCCIGCIIGCGMPPGMELIPRPAMCAWPGMDIGAIPSTGRSGFHDAPGTDHCAGLRLRSLAAAQSMAVSGWPLPLLVSIL